VGVCGMLQLKYAKPEAMEYDLQGLVTARFCSFLVRYMAQPSRYLLVPTQSTVSRAKWVRHDILRTGRRSEMQSLSDGLIRCSCPVKV
jgi:hypothetical protein